MSRLSVCVMSMVVAVAAVSSSTLAHSKHVIEVFDVDTLTSTVETVPMAPAPAATPPIRIPNPIPGPFVMPAGFGCSFDVLASPEGKSYITEFDDRRMVISNAYVTFTNLDSGTTYVQHSTYKVTETLLDADRLGIVADGRIFFQLYPGDSGPFGTVGGDGALYLMEGTSTSTLDLGTFILTSFSFKGTATDLCALLAG